MEVVNGKGDGQMQELWPCEKRPEDKFPVVEPSFFHYAESPGGSQERSQVDEAPIFTSSKNGWKIP